LRPDVVHVQGLPELMPAGDVPAVLSIHGLPHQDARYRSGRFAALAARFRERSFRRALPRYRRTIAISPYVLEEMGRVGDRSCRSIPNPVDDRFFDLTRRPEPKTVLYVGVLDRRKNALQLVEAAARLRESAGGVRYRMAGPWDPAYRATLMAAIEAHGLEKEFEFLGSIDRNQLLAELAGCTLLVLPSLQETAPMAIQEAMAARVPVAASAVGGVAHLLEGGRSGLLFDPRSTTELADALACLLQDDALRTRVCSSARQRAEAFRSEAVASATLEVYREAISNG
jgi:glycosyltransferase involved in cell wall biosynthesis